MRVSVCMATYNRSAILARTLASIREQSPPFAYEIIVCDDGSADDTADVCAEYGVCGARLDRPGYCNPAAARNVAYRRAEGDIIVAQSDDTYHETPDSLARLADITAGTFNIATVYEMDDAGGRLRQYTGAEWERPYFFLGSLWRKDLYAVGGDDEDFRLPGYDDDWLAARLIEGRGLRPVFRGDVVGCHQAHRRPPPEKLGAWCDKTKALYDSKTAAASRSGEWVAAGGAWRDE